MDTSYNDNSGWRPEPKEPKMRPLQEILFRMPDGWGEILDTSVHPSGASDPACRRRFMYDKRLGWHKPSWSESLDAGDIFHKIMKSLYGGCSIKRAIKGTQEDRLVEIHEMEIRYFEKYPDRKPFEFTDQKKALSLGAAMASAFNEAYPLPTTWKVKAAEQTITMPLEQVGVPGILEGALDAVIQVKGGDKYWIIDHKHTGSTPAERATSLSFDVQSQLYRALWNSAHPDKQVVGVIHNIISKPGIRQKKTETFEDYVGRYFKWFEEQGMANPGQPPALQSFVAFTSPPLHRNEELLEQIRPVAQLSVATPSLVTYPRVGSAYAGCLKRGKVCPYISLCQSTPQAWCDILQTQGFIKKKQKS